MTNDLTTRECEVLEAIRAAIRVEGRPPTLREMARSCGFKSTHSIALYLDSLERKGVIARGAGQARCIRVLDPGP